MGSAGVSEESRPSTNDILSVVVSTSSAVTTDAESCAPSPGVSREPSVPVNVSDHCAMRTLCTLHSLSTVLGGLL